MLETVTPQFQHRYLPFVVVVIVVMTRAPVNAVDVNETDNRKREQCDIHHTSCTQDLADMEVNLDIHPKPVMAMKDLIFKVTISGKSPTGVPYIDLSMPGMHMGPNRVHLRSTGDGRYEGQGVIVRCPSGRRTWKATVTIPGAGSAEFVFNVIY